MELIGQNLQFSLNPQFSPKKYRCTSAVFMKTMDFLPNSVVFDENCGFWPKPMDLAVSVWFLSLKLENC